jgi:hypothetical protein
VPVRRVARQAGDFQPHHESGATQPHVADQLLKAFAIRGRRTGVPQVAINDDHLLNGPPERHRAVPERILALRALRVFDDLSQRRLSDVQIGLTPKVPRGDLLRPVAGYVHAAS